MNTKYGIWNSRAHCFQFNICEDSPSKAKAKLYRLIGKDAYKWRFEARRLPLSKHLGSDHN